ncbi:ABC transporter substrate-binding protein [Stigmatella sp. ncwal1]|uniref:ABC transporter substrate-binding protein n=1 Tax=Stigmatella ashevillensis TaxID=2995309 RepID=A0ABT5DAM6_9BACT|nr:ABC transporter substrate-binding protein [Stigmatella ashevillena]MDC0710696.1 ABC transporter substrate-binding protein [Stigmatella ashevillena]
MRRLAGVRVLLALLATGAMAAEPPVQKLITVGPAITETVVALGAGPRLAGVDDSSAPLAPEARKLGYQRVLSAEGVLALGAPLLLASEEAGPPTVLEQLRKSGMEVVIFANAPTVEATRRQLLEVARRISRESQGQALAQALDEELARVASRLEPLKGDKRPKVLAIHARGAGALMVSGQRTAVDTLLRLAGGENATQGFEGHKALTAEAVVEAAPDILLVPVSTVKTVGGVEGLARLPALALRKNWRVVTLEDGHFMALGPRMGQAVTRLADAFHPVKPGAR